MGFTEALPVVLVRLMKAAEDLARESESKGLVLATQKTNATAKGLCEARQWMLDVAFDHYQRFFFRPRHRREIEGHRGAVQSPRRCVPHRERARR